MIKLKYTIGSDTLHVKLSSINALHYNPHEKNHSILCGFSTIEGNIDVMTSVTIYSINHLDQTKWQAYNDVAKIPQMLFKAVDRWLQARDVDAITILDARISHDRKRAT